MKPAPQRFDIFCRIVDNYGDAGVCWRLARLLAVAQGLDVTLWIDDRARLAPVVAAMDPARDVQRIDRVEIRSLHQSEVPGVVAADVVIEAFGCGLPPAYLDALERRRHVWINLEYLSAETWVDTRHGLPSPQPDRPLTRWFYFPGFTADTGGLLREPDLLCRRDRWVPSHSTAAADISLFCYENRALPALLEAWSAGSTPLSVQIPMGVAPRSLAPWLGIEPRTGTIVQHGAVSLHIVHWVDQPAFDRRLWASAVNIVRGEDSFVRAQWAQQPFAWHIYPQEANAHRTKLAAFLDRYLADAPLEVAAAVRAFWDAFNRQDGPATAAAWPAFWQGRDDLGRHNTRWATQLAALPELSASLVEFAKKRYNLRLW
jgi:uncharacterized repeat protein (TIGR03837 family)